MQASTRIALQIRVRLFASLRELTGESTAQVEVPAGSHAGDVWDACVRRWPALAARRQSTVLAVNQEFAKPDVPVHDGDEVALLPPVSGGGTARGSERMIELTDLPLNTEALSNMVMRPSDGGLVIFSGVVRNHSEDRAVRYLVYEAYREMALAKLEQVQRETLERWPMANVAMAHRLGRMEIGETSVIVAASAPHRAEAFAAGRYAIDRLKEIVPIWKKEFFAEGESWPAGSIPDVAARP
jgi:molybdopterin converting factor subunit 1